MADSAGILPKLNVLETEDNQKELYQTLPSLKLIRILKEIQDLNQRLHRVTLDIQRLCQDKEMKDITHTEVLEQRIAEVQQMNSHLEAIIGQKSSLIARLQKPFVKDFLHVEAAYQQYVCEALPWLVPTVSNLPMQLENIDWGVQLNLTNLDEMLSDVTGILAGQEHLCLGVNMQRQAMHSLASKLRHTTETVRDLP